MNENQPIQAGASQKAPACAASAAKDAALPGQERGRRGKARLAVFDFDGTSIDGNSPVLLVRYLMKKGMLGKSVLLRIGLWAVAYKLRLPQNESWVRGLVFTAFQGKPVAEVDAFLHGFYDEVVAPRFRAGADEAMRRHNQAGDVVLVVSATFEPIIVRAMELHPFQNQVSTRMKVDSQGRYTCQVEGLPVEGVQKLAAVRCFGDERFGAGNWELAYAYGDHHSDRVVLDAAQHPCAVNPDRPLSRTAKEHGWHVVTW